VYGYMCQEYIGVVLCEIDAANNAKNTTDTITSF